MHQIRKITILVCAILCVLCASALKSAGQATNLINYSQNNGSNAGVIVALPGIALPNATFNVQFGAISNNPNAYGGGSFMTNGMTNAIGAIYQVSTDPNFSTYLTVASLYPNGTNGEYDRWVLPYSSQTLYQRVIGVSTNSLPLGVWKTQ